ncbi:MAG: DUF5995 family protein [Actinomycetota bacterium]
MPADPLTAPAVRSVPEAVARMEAIAALLPPDDGLACFNRMYLMVTQLVGAQITAGFFADRPFMDRLDVVFANLYFGTVRASATRPQRAPRAWAALLERRTVTEVLPIQFALAGMNAHINHDLPLALVSTCSALRTSPGAGSHRRDYRRVNTLLARAEEEVRESFETGLLLEIDRRVRVENVIGNWSIGSARDAAWANATALWAIRDIPPLRSEFTKALDRTVGFAGRGLLTPVL